MSIDGGRVLIVNNNKCKIIKIGSVKIRMLDGVFKTLHGVRHARGLKRNLISLGMLDSFEYSFKSDNGGIERLKGILL